MPVNLKDRFPKTVFNRYTLVGFIFVLWMLFLDDNSYLFHRKLNTELEELKAAEDHYQKEIDQDKSILQELDSSKEMIEKIAREEYRMKKQNEDVYIISEKKEENE